MAIDPSETMADVNKANNLYSKQPVLNYIEEQHLTHAAFFC